MRAVAQTYFEFQPWFELSLTRLNLQITRANFQESLPIIQQALQDCHFFALDCEMTGLDLQDTKQEYLDEIEDRYHQVQSSLSTGKHYDAYADLRPTSAGACRQQVADLNFLSRNLAFQLLSGLRQSTNTDLVLSTSMSSLGQQMVMTDGSCLR